MVTDIEATAETTQVFNGSITSRQTLCPSCGKPAGKGKFCNSYGNPLGLASCPNCGAKNPTGMRFCGECGTKLK
jgi:hypothetical protein